MKALREGYYNVTRDGYDFKSLAHAYEADGWKLRFACFDGVSGEMNVEDLEPDVKLIPVKIVEDDSN
jgi:hypothetical protein